MPGRCPWGHNRGSGTKLGRGGRRETFGKTRERQSGRQEMEQGPRGPVERGALEEGASEGKGKGQFFPGTLPRV